MINNKQTWTVIHTEASLAWGGQEIRILREALGMRERGHRIVIVAQPGSDLLGKASEQGFEAVAMSFAQRDWPVTLGRLLKLFKQIRPDVINTHSSKDSWIAGIAARASTSRPILIRTRHLSTPVGKDLFSSLVYKGLPHRIVTTGEAIREQLIDRNHIRPEKVISIPTGVDLERFDPSLSFIDIRRELSLAPGTPLIGTVSVLRSWKGHGCLVEAAAQIITKFPDARFLIVGDGPQRQALVQMIKQKNLDDTIFLPGHRDDVPDIIASLDILVHPSYANEGIPQTLLQGLAMEIPIVSSDLTPLLEVIKHGQTGLTVPIKDAQALAGAIMTLLENRDLRKSLASRGRDTAKQFSREHMLDLTEQIYKTLLN